MILNDKQIRALGESLISPFTPTKVSEVNGERVLSYGVGSFGYDLRVSRDWKVFTNYRCPIIDPKHMDHDSFIDRHEDVLLLPPNGFALGLSVEEIHVPKDCMVVCLGKSTYARCGVIVNVTPIEPGWKGRLVIEFSNTSPCPVKLYANEGCIQLLFLRGEDAENDYSALGGKYDNQGEIILPKV